MLINYKYNFCDKKDRIFYKYFKMFVFKMLIVLMK